MLEHYEIENILKQSYSSLSCILSISFEDLTIIKYTNHKYIYVESILINFLFFKNIHSKLIILINVLIQ